MLEGSGQLLVLVTGGDGRAESTSWGLSDVGPSPGPRLWPPGQVPGPGHVLTVLLVGMSLGAGGGGGPACSSRVCGFLAPWEAPQCGGPGERVLHAPELRDCVVKPRGFFPVGLFFFFEDPLRC